MKNKSQTLSFRDFNLKLTNRCATNPFQAKETVTLKLRFSHNILRNIYPFCEQA